MINYLCIYLIIVYRKRIHLAENGDDSRRFCKNIILKMEFKWTHFECAFCRFL